MPLNLCRQQTKTSTVTYIHTNAHTSIFNFYLQNLQEIYVRRTNIRLIAGNRVALRITTKKSPYKTNKRNLL